jgi:transposase, IS5 family
LSQFEPSTAVIRKGKERRHGLNRRRYRGEVGMQRWVGLGVIADHLVKIGELCKSRIAQ